MITRLALMHSWATKTATTTRQSSLAHVLCLQCLMPPQNASLRLLWLLLYRPSITSRLRQRTTSAPASRYRNGLNDKRTSDRHTDPLRHGS